MAIARYYRDGGEPIIRQFPAPKRASELKYWYKAAKKMLPHLPDWRDSMGVGARISVEEIRLNLGPDGGLHIDRKGYLK